MRTARSRNACVAGYISTKDTSASTMAPTATATLGTKWRIWARSFQHWCRTSTPSGAKTAARKWRNAAALSQSSATSGLPRLQATSAASPAPTKAESKKPCSPICARMSQVSPSGDARAPRQHGERLDRLVEGPRGEGEDVEQRHGGEAVERQSEEPPHQRERQEQHDDAGRVGEAWHVAPGLHGVGPARAVADLREGARVDVEASEEGHPRGERVVQVVRVPARQVREAALVEHRYPRQRDEEEEPRVPHGPAELGRQGREVVPFQSRWPWESRREPG